MKTDGRQIAQLVWAVARSMALACGCAAAFAHGGAAAGSGVGTGASGNGVAGGGFGGHGAAGGHAAGHVGVARGLAHFASTGLEGHLSQRGPSACCVLGAGVVSPIWDPYFWSDHGYASPAADSHAEAAALPAPSANAPAANRSWYYCADSGGYYPYVRQCASAWQQISPMPSS